MNKVLMAVGALLVSQTLVAASNSVRPDPLPGADRSDCFWVRFAKDRRVLDNKRLLVWENGKSPYLVELDRPLQYLDSGGHSITFIDGDGDGQVCRSLRDAIVVQDAILPKRRVIVGVTNLSADQVQLLEQEYKTSLARKKRGQWGADSAAEAAPSSAEDL